MISKSTKYNIFFREDFSQKLISLVPNNVMSFWEIEIWNKNKITGYIRYNNNNIDAIYLNLQTKFSKLNSANRLCAVKFNFIDSTFMYDSIYSRYDPINDVLLYPLYEFRYDNDMNVIAEYHTIRNRVVYLDVDGIPTEKTSIQYKYGEKRKEYIVSTVQTPPNFIEDLNKINAIHGEYTDNFMIQRVKTIDNDNCEYYGI